MKSIILAATAFLVVASAAPDRSYYDTKYDNFDVDSILSNARLLKAYANCFLNNGKCTPDGMNFKRLLPEVLESGCAKCSPKQQSLIRKVLLSVRKQVPDRYAELTKHYDPEGKFTKDLERFLAQTN